MDDATRGLQKYVEGEEKQQGLTSSNEENITSQEQLGSGMELHSQLHRQIGRPLGYLPKSYIHRGKVMPISSHCGHFSRNCDVYPCQNGRDKLCVVAQTEKNVKNIQRCCTGISSIKDRAPIILPNRGQCQNIGLLQGGVASVRTIDLQWIKQLETRAKQEPYSLEAIPQHENDGHDRIPPKRVPKANQDLTTYAQMQIQLTHLGSVSSELAKDLKSKIPQIQRSLSQLPSTQIFAFNYIFEKALKHEVFDVHYAHLHILFLYASAFLLTFHSQNERQTIYYQIFQLSSKRLMEISNLQPQQIDSSVIMEVVANCLQYHKYRSDGGYYQSLLSQFVATYQNEMNTFMPLYCGYFCMVTRFDSVFPTKAALSSVLAFLKKIESDISAEYNNKDI